MILVRLSLSKLHQNKKSTLAVLFLFWWERGAISSHTSCANLVLPLAVNMFYLFRLVLIVLDGARLARYRKRYAAFRQRRNIDALRQNPVVQSTLVVLFLFYFWVETTPEILLGLCLALLRSSTALRSAQDDTGELISPPLHFSLISAILIPR